MDKLEEFKLFIKDKHFLAEKVKNGTYSWQTLYETYDMFGKEHEFFKDDSEKVIKEEKSTNEDNDNKQQEVSGDENGVDFINENGMLILKNDYFNKMKALFNLDIS